jgi:hypothetical protein
MNAAAIAISARVDDAKNARIAELEAALRGIAAGDVPRPVAVSYRADGRPCKDDMCEHGLRILESCDECTVAFVRGVLKST